MAKINSRQKGARGERELAHFLTAHGYPARRGQQFSGIEGDDVVCKPLNKFHVECKLVEALNIHKATAQSRRDSGPDQIPVVMHKKNRTEWLVTMPLEDFLGKVLANHPGFPPQWEEKKSEEKSENPCSMCGGLFFRKSKAQFKNEICNHCSAERRIL